VPLENQVGISFYKDLSLREYLSEPAIRCKRRFETSEETLFTFLKHDDVPWNNNNAEHAIKAYARAREVFQGSPTAKAISEYLVLLSVCKTCRNKRIGFLDFLCSGEKDIEAFVAANSRRRQRRGHDPSRSCAGTRDLKAESVH